MNVGISDILIYASKYSILFLSSFIMLTNLFNSLVIFSDITLKLYLNEYNINTNNVTYNIFYF